MSRRPEREWESDELNRLRASIADGSLVPENVHNFVESKRREIERHVLRGSAARVDAACLEAEAAQKRLRAAEYDGFVAENRLILELAESWLSGKE